MADTTFKQTEEILSEIYRNAELALQSIADILPQVDDEEVKQELSRQHEEYEKFSARAAMIAKDKGLEVKDPNPFKKMMMWGSIKMNSMMDNSRAHIADMMLKGTVMGITALKKSLGELSPEAHEDIRALAEEFLKMEEEFERIWKERL